MGIKAVSTQSDKNKYGQYFTPKVVAEFMVGLADISKNDKILEPSCGEGVFLDVLTNQGFNNLTAYEIDTELAKEYPFVRYESFVTAQIQDKFDLIIGNPPYIRWKNLEDELKAELSNHYLWSKYFNSLCDYLYIFILKSIELLAENGQLIFICPEYWMNTTHSITLRNYMVKNGYFEEIYHFNETPIFDNVTVSIIIFKFIKGKKKQEEIKVAKYYVNQKLTEDVLSNLKNRVPIENSEYITTPHFRLNERWILQSEEIIKELRQIEKACEKQTVSNSLFKEKAEYSTIGDICEIGNGLVSGLDKAFQINGYDLNDKEQRATIKVIKAKDLSPFYAKNHTNYIFLPDNLEEAKFEIDYPVFHAHLQQYKEKLAKRYQYNRKINYWEWVFLRNFNLFSKPQERIFVPCKERISNKNYFRFALANSDFFPTQDVAAIFKKTDTKESIEYILAYLNQPFIFDWLKNKGIVKGNIVEFSEKPIASIPFKTINWNNNKEIELHNLITDKTKEYLNKRDKKMLSTITSYFKQLLKL